MSDKITIANPVSTGGAYPIEVKQDVVSKSVALGNLRLVSAMTSVPYDTIQRWRKTDWWKEFELVARQEQQSVLDAKLSTLVDKTLETIEDRLINGELVLNNKTGELVRRPVSMRDTTNVANTLMTRQHMNRKESYEQTEVGESIKDTLSALAKEFAKWHKAKSKDVVDVESKEIEEE